MPFLLFLLPSRHNFEIFPAWYTFLGCMNASSVFYTKNIDWLSNEKLSPMFNGHPPMCRNWDWKTRFFATLLLTCCYCISYLHFSFWDIPEFSIIDWRHIPMPCLKFKNTFFPMHDACLLWSLQKRKCAILGFYDLNKTDGLENLTLGF